MTQPSGVTRVGLIVPSSNTVLEDELARLVPADGPVAVHVTRVRVTAISLAADALAQFDPGPMTAAAQLLGDALVQSVAWAGTAGSWLGVDYDRALADALARAAGAPATTSTLALLGACREAGIERVGLVTPYTLDVVARITETLRAAGLSVAAERHSGLTVNHSFAAVGPGEIERMALEAADGGAQAIVVLCTNMRGGPVGPAVTAATGLPVLDSCEVTLARAIAAASPGARQPALPDRRVKVMKLATFARRDGRQALGALLGDSLLDLSEAAPGTLAFGSMLALIGAGEPALDLARQLAGRAAEGDPDVVKHLVPAAEARLLAPIPRPAKNVFCVGLNYRSHVEQNAIALGQPIEIPDVPLFFSKPVTAVTGPGTPIRLDERLTSKLDWEVELTLVIGTGGTWIPEEAAASHIFGYTIANDVSARDLQWRTSQFLYGKGQDTYCPLGPVIVTADEVPPLDGIETELLVNGEVMQRESAGHMLFRPERVIAELSKGITLEPGDVITLGTPDGCGYQMIPPRFLAAGDVVECRATGIGSLVNTVTSVAATTGKKEDKRCA